MNKHASIVEGRTAVAWPCTCSCLVGKETPPLEFSYLHHRVGGHLISFTCGPDSRGRQRKDRTKASRKVMFSSQHVAGARDFGP